MIASKLLLDSDRILVSHSHNCGLKKLWSIYTENGPPLKLSK